MVDIGATYGRVLLTLAVFALASLLVGCSQSNEPDAGIERLSLLRGSCDPNYTGCVPLVDYDLDCADVGRAVEVLGVDIHRFDADGDGYGCESYG